MKYKGSERFNQTTEMIVFIIKNTNLNGDYK